ncbi:MAG: methyltransferase domain-containing protein [Nanoarchaeota archaeon]
MINKRNAFNMIVPEIKELFKDPSVEYQIRKTLARVLNYLEVEEIDKVIEFTIANAKGYRSLDDYERIGHTLFDEKRITQRIPSKLSDRAKLMSEQIREFVRGHQILDLGCGDGKVGEFLSKGRHVILSDVYKNGNISLLEMPFVKLEYGKKVSFQDNMFDTTLLLTVLHHSDDPHKLILEAKRITKDKGRIIVIESVYGVKGYDKNLTNEQQRKINIFFDHFYNRVIHYSKFKENKVNVPYNFQTPSGWKNFFYRYGLKQIKLIHLGFDQLAVPEYHTLHVLEVKK